MKYYADLVLTDVPCKIYVIKTTQVGMRLLCPQLLDSLCIADKFANYVNLHTGRKPERKKNTAINSHLV